MGRVFVPQFDGKFNISDLARYGEPHILFNKHLYPDEIDDRMPSIMAQAQHRLSNFDFAHDHLALVGSPIYIALCAFVLGWQSKYTDSLPFIDLLPLSMLRWDRHERKYYQIIANPHIGEDHDTRYR